MVIVTFKYHFFIFVRFVGGYDKEDKAARAYDLAALKYWGPTTTTNFPVSQIVIFFFQFDTIYNVLVP